MDKQLEKEKRNKETAVKACVEFKFKEILHGIGRVFTGVTKII